MNFESSVLAVVKQILGTGTSAEFTAGTLFVECTVAEAVKLETALLDQFNSGIILSRVGNESAYDFV